MLNYVHSIPFRIEGFAPDLQKYSHGHGFQQHGFSVFLELSIAQQLRDTPAPEGHSLNEHGIMYLQSIWGKYRVPTKLQPSSGAPKEQEKIIYDRPFTFFEDSLLVSNIRVPENACGLDIDHREIDETPGSYGGDAKLKRALGWYPHNVDSMSQAFALLSLWLMWLDIVEAHISEEL